MKKIRTTIYVILSFFALSTIAYCLSSCNEQEEQLPEQWFINEQSSESSFQWNEMTKKYSNIYTAEGTYHGCSVEVNSRAGEGGRYSRYFVSSDIRGYDDLLNEDGVVDINGVKVRFTFDAIDKSLSVEKIKGSSSGGDDDGGGDDGGGSGTLAAPKGFTLSQTDTYIKLSWNAVTGAAGYYVLWYKTSEEKWYILEETTLTSYMDYDVTAGATYIYGVAAFDEKGNTSEVAYDQITFNGNSGGGDNPGGGGDNPGGGGTTKPNTPSGVEATASSSSITVTWNLVSGADNYNVYRSTSSSGTYSSIATVYSTTYTDYDVNAGTTYYYKVTAENSAGESSKSSYASAKINSGGGGGGGNEQHYGPVITEVSGSVSGNYITVKWKTKTGSGWGWGPTDKIEVYIHDPIGNETYDGWGWRVDGTYTGSSATSGSHKISGYYIGYKDEYGSVKIGIKASNDYGTDSRTLVYIVDEKKWYY